MEITTEDAKTLSEMLGNTIKPGWSLQIYFHRNDGVREMVDVFYRDVRGNQIKVALKSDDDGYWLPLEQITHIHIY